MNYEYFTAPLTKTGEDGTSEDMTDEEKAAVTEELKALQAQVESGELTVEEAAEDYAASIDSDSNYVQSVNSRDNMTASYLPEAFITSLESMREGAIQVFEGSGYMVFLHRLPIADAVEEELSNEDNRLSLMIELRNEEFQDYVREAAASVEGVEMNEEAISRYQPSMFESTTENGTSSTPEESSDTESSSSESSSASGEESSASESSTEE